LSILALLKSPVRKQGRLSLTEVAPKSSSSAAYEDQWRNGKKDGFGSEFDEIGEGYIGQFKNGSYHGKGTDTILPIVLHFATI